jgi:hypothetical protein
MLLWRIRGMLVISITRFKAKRLIKAKRLKCNDRIKRQNQNQNKNKEKDKNNILKPF